MIAARTILLEVSVLLFACRESVAAEAESPPPAEAAFAMAEVPVFGKASEGAKGQKAEPDIGHPEPCTADPDTHVKLYPKLQSARPQYGTFRFGKTPVFAGEGPTFRFVVDESGGTGKGYDRIYFDANGDGNLTNDPVPQPMAKPPTEAIVPGWKQRAKQIVFDGLNLPVDYGPGLGVRPLRLLARLVIFDEKQVVNLFLLPTVERKGKITIGKRQYEAVLKLGGLTGRFDRPITQLRLTPLEPTGRRVRWGQGEPYLGSMLEVDGQLYSFSATPTGDRLFVRAYRGPYGTLTVGPGRRDIKRLEVREAILCSETAFVCVPQQPGDLSPADTVKDFLTQLWQRSGGKAITGVAKDVRVPVGDYSAAALSLDYGRLRLGLLATSHSEGHSRDRQGKPLAYPISIRENKPYVLDFSAQPEVVFTSPTKDRTYRRGDPIEVATVLTVPALDITFRRLYDTSRKQTEVHKDNNGKEYRSEGPLALDPLVSITDSSGRELAKGKMPFG